MRSLLLVLALGLLGSGFAAGSLTCSVSNSAAGCFIEQPAAEFGPLSVAFGVDAQLALDPSRSTFLAPYTVITYAADRWSAWAEFALPNSSIPTFGRPDPWRLGISWSY